MDLHMHFWLEEMAERDDAEKLEEAGWALGQ